MALPGPGRGSHPVRLGLDYVALLGGGRVSLPGGPGVQLLAGKDRPRPRSGVRGSPVTTFLGPLGPDPDCGAGRCSLCPHRKELLSFPSRAWTWLRVLPFTDNPCQINFI